MGAGKPALGEAAGGEAQGGAANRLGGIGQPPPHPLSGALAGGQLALHGGGRKGGLQGLGLGELVDLGRPITLHPRLMVAGQKGREEPRVP